MALFNNFGYLYCSQCVRSHPGLSLRDRGAAQVLREAYRQGWVTVHKSRYDGGDGVERAYCPQCASSHRENRFRYEL